MGQNEETIAWLLDCSDPSVRYWTLVDLLDLPASKPEVQEARKALAGSQRIQALLDGQGPDGNFGVHPYQKWTGSHWRLVSLVELGAYAAVPAPETQLRLAADSVLRWLTGQEHRNEILSIAGLWRRHASQEGNALAACCRLGLAEDPCVASLARSLLEWQWPDGGWNCDKDKKAERSSFYETLSPLWGLIEYWRATGKPEIHRAARRAAEVFLRRRLFRSQSSGEVINAEWLKLHYPLYWHYDILQALLILSRLGPLADPRLEEALDLLEAKRLPDGCWKATAAYWRPPGTSRSGVEVVDWGRSGPQPFITLNAMRVLKAAGRLGDLPAA
jgi:hypothetical protein